MVEINGEVMRMRSTAFRKFRDYAGGDGFVAALLAMTYPGCSLSLRARRTFSPERSRIGSHLIVTQSLKYGTSRLSGLQARGDLGPGRRHVTERV
jgi:hypothetical protein